MKLVKLSSVRLIAGSAALAVLFFVNFTNPAKASNDIVTGFNAQQVLQPGLIVSKDNSQPRLVKATPSDAESSIYGVVVDPSDAPVTLNGSGQQVFVATSGIYRVLVSSINGVINPGDYISMSSLNGIGAKATPVQNTVVGQAENGFNGSANVISNNNGQAIGRIYVNLNIERNPIENSAPIPNFLKHIAVTLANKPVSVVRIYVALIIFLITVIAAVTILWSGVRSSLVSLGRNPLSRHVILGGMYKAIVTGLLVFGIGVIGVYLLLKI